MIVMCVRELVYDGQSSVVDWHGFVTPTGQHRNEDVEEEVVCVI